MTSLGEPSPIFEVEICEGCGRRYPSSTDPVPGRPRLCEPCVDVRWREERRG